MMTIFTIITIIDVFYCFWFLLNLSVIHELFHVWPFPLGVHFVELLGWEFLYARCLTNNINGEGH